MDQREQIYFSALQGGDQQAFETLFLKYYKGMVGFVRFLAPVMREDAQDIVADVFAHLWNNRCSIALTGSLKAYLYTAARNRTIDCLRAYNARPTVLVEDPVGIDVPSTGSPEDILLYKEAGHHIRRLIDQLPPQMRLVFRMSRDEELTYEEIAAILDISVYSVKTHMYRALKYLKECYATYGG